MDPARPSPIEHALARLGALTVGGALPERVTEAIGDIIAGWAAEADMDPGTAQARIERLWDSVSKDAAELEEQISDAAGTDAQALAGAKRALTAMRAAVTALAAAHERL